MEFLRRKWNKELDYPLRKEFRTLLVERRDERLRHYVRCPECSDVVEQTYEKRPATSGKKPDRLVISFFRQTVSTLLLPLLAGGSSRTAPL